MNDTFIMFGLYLMHLYTVIQMNLYLIWMYCFENSLVVHWIRNLKYEVRSRICSYKIEPNYPYICICSGDSELYLPIGPEFQNDMVESFNVIANSVKCASHQEGYEYLLLMRNEDTLISRIFSQDKDDYAVDYEKSRKHFLSIEYTHPDMPDRIIIELDPALYLVGNEILSSRFILRCLQYQSSDFVFDDRYILDIMDSKIKMLSLNAGEYVLIGKTEYEKKGLKI
jgi:hypothetical protein